MVAPKKQRVPRTRNDGTMTEAQCTKCLKTLPTHHFYTQGQYRVNTCKSCWSERRRAAYWRDPERARAASREWGRCNPITKVERNLRTNYGINLSDYQAMLSEQGGACAICRGTEPKDGRNYFHVDHCHATGKVRGLLCGTCNRGLGFFYDDPTLLAKAQTYLESTKDTK